MTTLERREPLALLIVGAAVLAWSGLFPKDRQVWLMEVAPALAGVAALVLTRPRFPMTPLTYRLIFVFSVVLMVGGKYTYAEVPLGFWARDLFHLQRNHFDRVGHFLQGMIPAILAREMLIRCTPLRPGKAVFWICSKVFSSNFTFTPGWVRSNSLIAWFHATPMALSGLS